MSELIAFKNIKAILFGESGIGKTPIKNAFKDESFNNRMQTKILMVIYEVLFKIAFYKYNIIIILFINK